ncbi:ATP-binding protein [Roseospira visakhapatnamensis]|uniref:Anti-sigma regulatory factor (Ser/Thr protein kinase) n=1 Tax=Roseospira visakhapatnamensis TaxID=390880 RepID=A0A7W6W8A6_9PROT|nr:ATP-binding protein [Roseospira visakhapatnamensis]MBB4264649.1 anti-sigma regulatory factor (Ser/Thr protein kinase) [Roseospira visakhapatnamensis]
MPSSFMDPDPARPDPTDAALADAGLRLVTDGDLRAWGHGLVRRALAPPGRGLVVTEAAATAPTLRGLALTIAAADGVALLLSAGTAWMLDTAESLTDAVVSRWPDLHHRHAILRLAVHEALVNAALHGCFGIPPDLRDRPEGWLAHTAAIEEALADPARSLRPLLVGAAPDATGEEWAVWIADDGPGFDAATADAPGADPPAGGDVKTHALRGRGLRLMRTAADAIAWRDGGRQVCMTLRRAPG